MLKAIGGLAAVSFFAQAFQLLAQPLLARLYTPAQFGLVAQVVFLASLFSIVGTIQIHNYLVIIKSDDERKNLVRFGELLAAVSSLVVMLCVSVFSETFFHEKASHEISILTASIFLALCQSNLIRGAQTAGGYFKLTMFYGVARAICLIGAQVGFGLAGSDNGLLYGMVFGEFAAQFIVRWLSIEKSRDLSISRFTFREGWAHLKKSLDFLLSGTLQEFFSVAVAMFPLYMMSRVYGNDIGGQFSLAHKMAWAPILLVTQSIAPVLYRQFAGLEVDQIANSKLLRPSFIASVFSVGLFSCYAIVDKAFILVFGAVWRDAADMSVWISVMAFAFLSCFPCRLIYRVLNKQRVQLYIDAIALLLILSAFFLAENAGFILMVQILTAVCILQNFLLAYFSRWLLARAVRTAY